MIPFTTFHKDGRITRNYHDGRIEDITKEIAESKERRMSHSGIELKGAGDHFADIVELVGIEAESNCDCIARQKRMNEAGPVGVNEIRIELIEEMVKAYKEFKEKHHIKLSAILKMMTWQQIIRAAIDPKRAALDAMIDEAIRRTESTLQPITIVIPCHNYARYLKECLDSVMRQTLPVERIIVIDDASDDNPKPIVDASAAEYERVEYRNVHATRAHGFAMVKTPYVLFLDADNTIPPLFIASALREIGGDRTIAGVHPKLEAFDGKNGTHIDPPDVLHADDIAGRNWIDSGTVWRTELVKQGRPYEIGCDKEVNTHDWLTARRILGVSEGLRTVKNRQPLGYRIHGNQMSSRNYKERRVSYYDDAMLFAESVTIILALAGRWQHWPERLEWLQRQTWPHNQCRLLILNGEYNRRSARDLQFDELDYESLQLIHHNHGREGLADINRRISRELRYEVETAVGAIYNRAVRESATEYLFFLEDDIFCQDDAIEQLMRSMHSDVAGVTGAYEHRYRNGQLCAFHFGGKEGTKLQKVGGSGETFIDGSGFGCLLTRRSVLRKHPFAGDAKHPHYDVAFADDLKRTEWKWKLNLDVVCEHRFRD